MVSVGWCPTERIADQPITADDQVSSASPLVHQADLGAGVRIDVDLLSTGQGGTVSFGTVDDTSGPLLRVLLGEGELSAASGQRLVDPAGAVPWLRLAVVDALDRWLHTPLDQSVVDAERAVGRVRAARTLPDGPARTMLVGDALRLARCASGDFAAVLRKLSASPVPHRLRGAVQDLVDGYAELADEIHGRRDRELKAVLASWRRRENARRPPPAPSAFPATAPPRSGCLIDPRQVPARVLGLSADPRTPEISLSPTADGDAVRVRVPAFGPVVDADIRARLGARLISRRSGRVKLHVPMVRAVGGFATALPLCGLDPADARVDVFDEWSDLPPARTDTEPALLEARRAVTFLTQWRRLVGAAQLGVASPGLAGRLHDIADRLRPGFPGGPSPSDLDAVAELGDRDLLHALRGSPAQGPFATTQGAAGLLVAELVAVHGTA